MEPNYRRFLIAMTAAVVIATSAGLVIADSPSRARLVVAHTEFSDEQAGAASISAQSFFTSMRGTTRWPITFKDSKHRSTSLLLCGDE